VRAAFLHVLGDAVQSIGVMIAAGLIWHDPSWNIADPVCTFLFSVLVLATTVRLIRESVHVLMEGTPEGINPSDVLSALQAIHGVREVHDLHIWSLSVGKPSLSVHLLVDDEESDHILQEAHDICSKRWKIHHTTIQVETTKDKISCNEARSRY